MTDEEARAALQRLIEDRGEDYSGLSRLLGRNPAYIQQYVRRGSPRRLAENDRRRLAAYFGVEDSRLGGPSADEAAGDLVRVRRLDVGASAGAGAEGMERPARGVFAFDRAWLRRLGGGSPDRLSLVRVEGDSMTPTLDDGDEILVDASDAAARLRDGIYVLRTDEGLMVKRLSINPATGGISVISDNPAWPAWRDCAPDRLRIIGRVLWAGRRFG